MPTYRWTFTCPLNLQQTIFFIVGCWINSIWNGYLWSYMNSVILAYHWIIEFNSWKFCVWFNVIDSFCSSNSEGKPDRTNSFRIEDEANKFTGNNVVAVQLYGSGRNFKNANWIISFDFVIFVWSNRVPSAYVCTKNVHCIVVGENTFTIWTYHQRAQML